MGNKVKFIGLSMNFVRKGNVSTVVLRSVDSTILFFQEDLFIVITLEHTRENRIEEYVIEFSSKTSDLKGKDRGSPN